MYRILLNMVLYVQGSTELGFFYLTGFYKVKVLYVKGFYWLRFSMYRVYGVWFSMYRVLLIMVLYVQCSTEFGSQCTRFHLVWFSMYNGSNEFGSLCTGFYWVWFSMYMVLLRMYNGVVLVIESKHEETWTLSANNPERAETSASLSFFLSLILSLSQESIVYIPCSWFLHKPFLIISPNPWNTEIISPNPWN